MLLPIGPASMSGTVAGTSRRGSPSQTYLPIRLSDSQELTAPFRSLVGNTMLATRRAQVRPLVKDSLEMTLIEHSTCAASKIR